MLADAVNGAGCHIDVNVLIVPDNIVARFTQAVDRVDTAAWRSSHTHTHSLLGFLSQTETRKLGELKR